MNKITIEINGCEQCPYFDMFYYGYNEKCKKLNRKIVKDRQSFTISTDTAYKSSDNYPIPDDCPFIIKKIKNES